MKAYMKYRITAKGHMKVARNLFYCQAQEGHTGIGEKVLRLLDSAGPLMLREIAERTGFPTFKVYSTVYNLIFRGEVERAADSV